MLKFNIDNYINKRNTSVVNIVAGFYLIFLTFFVLIYIFVLKKDTVFFLRDDGYYTLGKYFYEGRISLLYQLRSPGILLFFSFFNFFPEPFHPFLRLFITFILSYSSLLLSSKIFENMLSKKQMLIGFSVSVFNPVFIHFTIKSTPEIYLLFFLGLIIFFYRKYLKEYKIKYLLLVIMIIFLAMSFKPVFFLISFFLIGHSILVKNFKRLVIPLSTFSVISVIVFFLSSVFTKPANNNINFVFVESVIVPTYIIDAIMKTGELNLGTKEEYLNATPEKSNYTICMDSYNEYLSDYKKRNSDYSEYAVIVDFIKNNFFKFSLVKLLSPVTFISLSSNSIETVVNFFLNIILIILSIASIKRIFREHKSDILVIICVILGYSFVFFLSACYIRYSLPAIFYLYPFTGILIHNYISKIFKKKKI
jgi:hypothetical protein